jgi:trigger factor
VAEVKEKVMPEVNDEFAKSYGAESLEKLRAGVRSDLQNELDFKQKRDVRNQVMNALLNQVNFDLPESSVAHETRNVVYNLVRENQKRGISRDVIEKEKDQIYNAASVSAKERVKAQFLMQKIAEKEDIKVSQEEVLKRIQALAGMYQIPPDQFLKDLQKRNGLVEIYDQVASEKVIDFLEVNAKVEEVEPPAQANPS